MLYIAHLWNMATEIFKALHGFTPIYIRDLFEEKVKFYYLRSTVSLKNSFWYKVAKILNDLPNKLKNSITIAQFK